MMKAALRRLHSPDVQKLSEYRPDGPFGILIQAMIGPAEEIGEESFDFVLCTVDWFAARMRAPLVLGRHYVFVKQYDYPALVDFVCTYAASCEAENWACLGEKLGRLGKWEFEDYQVKKEDLGSK